MSRKRMKMVVKEDVQCNLIPMVDIMFLLLLFFILSADMTQREAAELVLPEASEIKEEDKIKSLDPTTTVNIQHRLDSPSFKCPVHAQGRFCRDNEHWGVVIQGREIPRAALKDEMQVRADETLEPDVDPVAGKRLSARKVIIRADRAAPYGDIQKIIEVCSMTGIYKIEVGAALPPK